MSIHTALLAGTSGLRANASALAATSDNIANANTVGFKRIRNDFTALLVGQNAYTSYNAGGVLAGQTQEVGEQGALGTSQISTHLAISGEGMFVTRAKADDATAADDYYFTRAGQFAPDAEGFLKNTAGLFLYGWPVADDGSVTAGPSDLGALEPVQITGISGAAQATENISFSANLDAAEEVSAAASTYDLTTSPNLSMASGDFTPDFQTTVQIYDSLGGIKTVAMSFLKSPTPNEWYAEVHVIPASDMQATGLPDGLLASGTVAFTASGQLDMSNTTLPSSITIGGSDTVATSPNVGWATGAGLDAQTLTLDFAGGSATGALTQYDSPSEADQSVVDGLAYGVLSTVEIDEEGYVNALFTNGMSRRVYQLPLATFSNYAGLKSAEGGAFTASPDAGALILSAAGESGAGTLRSQALEASTVDLAEEFTNLITTQRAYSASSKIITTADEMLDELIRLKR